MSLSNNAKLLAQIIQDYQHDDGVQISEEGITLWANQFNENALFVLSEVRHLLQQTYYSKQKCRELLKARLEKLSSDLHYPSVHDFIQESCFFDVQKEEKSQKAVLKIIFNILEEDYKIHYEDFQLAVKRNFIYFDDLLASGGTVRKDVLVWLLESEGKKRNYQRVIDGECKLIVSTFAKHVFGAGLCKWQLMMNTDKLLDKKLHFYCDVEIQDHPRFPGQTYNCMMPLESELSKEAWDYLHNLDAEGQPTRAFRPVNSPMRETVFSSSEARNRLEKIFIEKGIQLFESVMNLASNQRPLGMTPPSHRTFGMGTLFFTWRNIPNNAPIVFWWDNNNWHPLFPLKNRGLD